jgi:adenylate cyclase
VVPIAAILAAWLLLQRLMFLPVGFPVAAGLVTSVALLAVTHLQDWLYAKRLAGALARFVSPALLQQVRAGADPAHGGEARRAEAATLFLDLAGFTKFCEAQEPEAIAEFLARFYRLASDCIVGHSGTVDKVLGDGILAYFGAPAALTDKERRAVSATLAAVERFASLSRELAGRGFPDLQ